MKIFRCVTYVHSDDGKLEPRSIKCIFLAYKGGVTGYSFGSPKLD